MLSKSMPIRIVAENIYTARKQNKQGGRPNARFKEIHREQPEREQAPQTQDPGTVKRVSHSHSFCML